MSDLPAGHQVKVDRVCPVCSTVFSVYPSRLSHGRGINCSKECQYIAKRMRPSVADVVDLECAGCRKQFERSAAWLIDRPGGGKYCSRACRDTNWKGEATPNWQGGNGVYKRGPHWYSIRREVLRRDNHTCQKCGATGRLHVHHKTPFRMFDDPDIANDLSNLVSLCAPCHRTEDAAMKWEKIGGVAVLFSPAEWALRRAANDNVKLRITA